MDDIPFYEVAKIIRENISHIEWLALRYFWPSHCEAIKIWSAGIHAAEYLMVLAPAAVLRENSPLLCFARR